MTTLKFRADTVSLIFSKEQNSAQNVGGVRDFILCTLSDDTLFCIKLHENIFDGIEVIQRTRYH